MKICCILNQKSGSAGSAEEVDIVGLFSKHGINPEILHSTEGSSISDLAEKAAQQNYDVIVAGGGDGTISAVAAALVDHPSTRLGILPMGTLNHFARDLGIPFDVAKAVDIICAGYSEAVDIGCVNERYFVNNSSVGLYPAVVKLRESLQSSGYSKWWAALLSSIRIFSRFRRLHLEVHGPTGEVVTRKTALLFVGNNVYETTPAKLGTRHAINRGQLWVNMPVSSTRTGLFFNLIALVFGHEKPADSMMFEATSLKVISKKKLLTVAADGEVLRLVPPLNYRILPKSLDILVPARQEDA